jgi:type I restriction enzyme, S subunit
MSISERWSKVQIQTIRSPKKYSLVGGPFGSNLVSRDYQSEGVPVIRGGNLPDHSSFSYENLAFISEDKADSLLPNNAYPGDLIFTQRGTLGQVGLIPEKSPYKRFVISQSQMKLTVDEKKVDARFVYYYFRLSSTVQAIENYALSSGIPHINLDILRKFEIPLPPLKIQKKITSVISAYDRLIENNKRRIALLEKMAEEIYREWFVRMRFPGHEQVVFHKGIPEGWLTANLEELGFLGRGKSKHRPRNDPSLYDGEYPFIQTGDVKSASPTLYVIQHEQTYNKNGLAQSKLWDQGTLLITIAANIAETAILNYPACFPDSIIGFIPHPEKVTAEYIKFSIDCLKVSMQNISQGTTQDNLSQGKLSSFVFLLPSQTVMQQFQQVSDPIFAQIKNLLLQNQNLEQTRDRLLPRLISGKLAVEDLDIQFPPSMSAAEAATHER